MTSDEKHDLAVGLREYVERLLCEHDKRDALQFSSMREAIDLAKVDLERRLESLNELRTAVERDRAQFVKQEVYDTKTAYYDNWCRGVDNKLTTLETRSLTWTAAIGVAFTLLQIAIHFWK